MVVNVAQIGRIQIVHKQLMVVVLLLLLLLMMEQMMKAHVLDIGRCHPRHSIVGQIVRYVIQVI